MSDFSICRCEGKNEINNITDQILDWTEMIIKDMPKNLKSENLYQQCCKFRKQVKELQNKC
jgi:hypothetical protein